ncbi:MAG TPA: sensor histidine kinase [Campylobacterales bacterium]|nr:sensor histidine kinase [Campylobacterales bacterium]
MAFLFGNSGRKFLIATIFMGFAIVGGVMWALVMLRDEAIDTHLKIAELHAATFSEHLGQTVLTIDYTMSTLAEAVFDEEDDVVIGAALSKALRDSPFLRSLSVLNIDGEVSISSNPQNIGKKISLDGFIPIPAFDESIPRFANTLIGRDLYDGVKIDANKPLKANELSFTPIIKKVLIGKKDGYLLATLNNEYFLRKYSQSMDNQKGYADIVLIDGTTLASTDKNIKIGFLDASVANIVSKGADYSFVNATNSAKRTLEAYRVVKNLPLAVSVRLDYDKTLIKWEKQRLNVLFVTTILVILSATLTLLLIIRHKKQQIMEEKALKSKMVAMSEMISMIAHQWRQPLAMLSGIYANILDAYEYEELTDEYLRKKTTQASGILKYLSKTIDDFRGFFRPDEDKKEFCLCAATEDAMRLMYSQLSSNGLKIYLNDKPFSDASERGCDVYMPFVGYKNEFVHVVFALLKNSSEAIEKSKTEHGEIRITARAEHKAYIVEIADNGGGVLEEAEDKIFDPYFTTKHDYMGAGMGLYMAKTAIEKNMKGKLYFENEHGGAKFYIELSKDGINE